MKKSIIKLSAGFLALFCVVAAVVSVSADTVLEYYGYQYTIINNTSVALAGWDNRTPELIVPNTIEKRDMAAIGNFALRNNTEITSVNLNNVRRLKSIGMYAFQGCTGISSEINMPNCINQLGTGAFSQCSSLPGVTISDYVTAIPEECFYGCSMLTDVKLSERLESIGRIAFMNCTSLEYVEIPKSVTFIHSNAFKNDNNLTLGVWYDSYAYVYAKEQNIPYVLLDGVKLGDANGDGVVNVNDVTAIQRHLAQIQELEGIHLHAADTNLDGVDDVTNVTTLQGFLAEFETEYPIGEVMTQ